MKTVRVVDVGDGFSFKIEQDDGENLETLAVNLSESLNTKSYYEKQHSAFMLQSQNERRKATENKTLLYQLKEYRRNKERNPGMKVSRMEPMEFYDDQMIKDEMELYLKNANDFHEKSDMFMQLAKDEEKKIAIIQRKIIEARRQAANDGT
jgi:hypothetical protein